SALASSTPSSDPNDYLHRRFLALYLQVHLTEVSAGVALGIQGKDSGPGLSISTSEGRKFDLGGRDLQNVEKLEGKYFNLWLRGPAGARGSDDQTLPEHSGLALPLNGW